MTYELGGSFDGFWFFFIRRLRHRKLAKKAPMREGPLTRSIISCKMASCARWN